MLQFDSWCAVENSDVGNQSLSILTVENARRDIGIVETAGIVPEHYLSKERISHVLCRLGKVAAGKLIQDMLPTEKRMRSGDLGEIYATEWINSESGGYAAPLNRLRWKDHPDMAMRGEDVIALRVDPHSQRLQFLKAEVKSGVKVNSQVLRDARVALDKDRGLPSAHALQFISARLFELGDRERADAIDDAQLNQGISTGDVQHLIFLFSGNSSRNLLTTCLQSYQGQIRQIGVGLRVDDHAAFIVAVFDRVTLNANNT